MLEGSGNISHRQGLNRQQLIGGFHKLFLFPIPWDHCSRKHKSFFPKFHHVSSYFSQYSPMFHDVKKDDTMFLSFFTMCQESFTIFPCLFESTWNPHLPFRPPREGRTSKRSGDASPLGHCDVLGQNAPAASLVPEKCGGFGGADGLGGGWEVCRMSF